MHVVYTHRDFQAPVSPGLFLQLPTSPTPLSYIVQKLYHTWVTPPPPAFQYGLWSSGCLYPQPCVYTLYGPPQFPMISVFYQGLWVAPPFTMASTPQLQDAFLGSHTPVTAERGCLFSRAFALFAAALSCSKRNLHPVAIKPDPTISRLNQL